MSSLETLWVEKKWRAASITVACGLHPRLGAKSLLCLLPQALMADILDLCRDLLTEKAMAAIETDRFADAAVLLRQALDQRPHFVPAVLALRSLRLYRPYVGTPWVPSAISLIRRAKSAPKEENDASLQYFESHSSSRYAQFLHGCWHYFVMNDPASAVPLWLPLTDRCVMSMNCLGNCYCDGEGIERDGVKGVALFLRAAEKNHAAALNNIGFSYLTGCGLPRDKLKAVQMFESAAKQGSVQATYNLGWSFEKGTPLAKNIARAIELYTKIAEQDHTSAQYNLGLIYKYGAEGVSKDIEKAKKWLSAAAKYDGDAKSELEQLLHEEAEETGVDALPVIAAYT